MLSLYDYPKTMLLLAEYMVALNNGDDTTEIASSLNVELKDFVERHEIEDCEKLCIELFEALFAHFREMAYAASTKKEFNLLQERFIEEYNKLFVEIKYCNPEIFIPFLKYLNEKSTNADDVAKHFVDMMSNFKTIDFVETKRYVLSYCVNMMMRLNLFHNKKYINVLKDVVAILKVISQEKNWEYEDKYPSFLG